jgi:hypothetical protein
MKPLTWPAKPADIAAQLPHPYARYGLAVALRRRDLATPLTEDELRADLIFAIEDGLGHFRMQTADDPQHSTELKFTPVKMSALLDDTNLVQSAGLAARGIYLYPSVVTIDGGAKDTFKNAQALLEAVKVKKTFDSSTELSRSFAPTTAKINSGTASQTPPKGILLEAVCSVITTLTANKPAVWLGDKGNTVITPELPLAEMRRFISLFDAMAGGESSNLMLAKLPPKPATPPADAPAAKAKKAAAPKKAPASEYRRPRLHSGNYPDAPYQPEAFGPVGLLAAIGRWARRARQTPWATEVLASLVGAPLYVVSYDNIRQVQFGHHVVQLAQDNHLADIVAALYRDTLLYRDGEAQRRYDNPTYQLFYFTAARFLQLFNRAAFADFLAQRAEYAPAIQPLFNAYFMSNLQVPAPVVESAKALGRWLNTTAYRVAEDEVDASASNRAEVVKKTKAKILVEFESAAMSAKNAPDLLFRISTRAGRLLGSDAPAAAEVFMDATALGEEQEGGISKETATHLLIAYMRLRSKTRKPLDANETAETNAAEATGAPAVDDSDSEDIQD